MKHLTYANVAATLALFAAIAGGTALALPGRNSVDSGDIRNRQVKAADLQQPKVKRIKANPAGGQDPCAAGKAGVLCGYQQPEVGYRGWSPVGGGLALPTMSRNGWGEVRLSGVVQKVVRSDQSSAIAILPRKFRPARAVDFAVAGRVLEGCGGSGCPTDRIRVSPNGHVEVGSTGSGEGGIGLDGIVFRAKR